MRLVLARLAKERRPLSSTPLARTPPKHPPSVCDVRRGKVHLRTGSIRRASILLKACLGQLLANAPVQSQGEAWLSMAKCEIAEVSLGDSPSSAAESHDNASGSRVEGEDGVAAKAEVGGRARRGKALRRAVVHLDKAIATLKRCHDFTGLRECFYLKVGGCVVRFRRKREGGGGGYGIQRTVD